ncbi:MAG: class I SAM-dependent methyltransferase [Rariglobus sp.]
MQRHEKALERLRGLQVETVLAGATLDAMRPRFNTLRDRHDNGTAPRAVSAFNLFQTPSPLAARLVAALELTAGARVLEPSVGLGRLLDQLAPFNPSEVVAVETSADICAELYRQNREGVTLKQRDFLTLSPDEVGTFDAVVMNPPFHMRADIRHILHARKFLRPGGVLVALCMAGPHRERELRPLSCVWEEIPAGTFKAEGTGVATVLLVMRG